MLDQKLHEYIVVTFKKFKKYHPYDPYKMALFDKFCSLYTELLSDLWKGGGYTPPGGRVPPPMYMYNM